LDILPIPASSVPCERLFSAAKEVADDRRSRLGSKKFEEMQVMKFAWRNNIPNLAAWNSNEIEEIEEIDAMEYSTLLIDDNWQNNFDGTADVME
jgi:hAT family C-terminal dimerisation region